MTIILLQLQRHRGLVETLQPLDTKVVSSILALGDTQFGFFNFYLMILWTKKALKNLHKNIIQV